MADSPDPPAKVPRALTSNVNITLFGLVTFPVDVLPIFRSKDGLRLVCPECDEPTRVKERYVCPEHIEHGPYSESELHRAVEVDKVLHKATEDEVAAFYEPEVPSGSIEFHVYRSDQVVEHTLQTGAVYRLRPKNAAEHYATIQSLVAGHPELAFCGQLTMRYSQKLYRLDIRDGVLMLAELSWPMELHPLHFEVPSTPSERALEMINSSGLLEPEEFDANTYLSPRRVRLDALIEAKRNPETARKPEPGVRKPEETEDNLIDMLTHSITVAKRAETVAEPKKPAKKAAKRPAKKAAKKATKRPAKTG